MKLFYMCLAMAVFLIISFGFVGPTGVSADSTIFCVATMTYLTVVVPYVIYKGFGKLKNEVKTYNKKEDVDA